MADLVPEHLEHAGRESSTESHSRRIGNRYSVMVLGIDPGARPPRAVIGTPRNRPSSVVPGGEAPGGRGRSSTSTAISARRGVIQSGRTSSASPDPASTKSSSAIRTGAIARPYRLTPTSTGSGSSTMANRSYTPSRTVRARSRSSAVVHRHGSSAPGCAWSTGSPSGSPYPRPEPGVLDQPGCTRLDRRPVDLHGPLGPARQRPSCAPRTGVPLPADGRPTPPGSPGW